MSDRAAIADRLHSLAIHLLRRVAKSDQQSGVTAPRLSVLSVLVLGGGPRTMGELAAAERVRPPTMTRLVQAMEAEGLVTRAAAPEDARVVRIRATRTGERVLAQARARRLSTLRALLADLTARDLVIVERAITLLEPLVARAT